MGVIWIFDKMIGIILYSWFSGGYECHMVCDKADITLISLIIMFDYQ